MRNVEAKIKHVKVSHISTENNIECNRADLWRIYGNSTNLNNKSPMSCNVTPNCNAETNNIMSNKPIAKSYQFLSSLILLIFRLDFMQDNNTG